jgi:DNA invertase Pin-like site-specific DNA recombinase
MIMAHIGYIRVPIVDVNEHRQEDELRQYQLDKIYTDTASIKTRNRPQLQLMLDSIQKGDIVYVFELNALARDIDDLMQLARIFDRKGVTLVCKKEKLDTSGEMGKLIVHVLEAVAEFERDNFRERQKHGIAIAKAQGKYKGRQPKTIDKDFLAQYDEYTKTNMTKKQLAEKLEISRPTLDKLINEHAELKKQLPDTST